MGKGKTFFVVVFVLVCFNYSNAQTCCTDFLGGARISFGYGVSTFNAAGLNDYINVYNSKRPNLNKKMDEFGMGMGFHGGIEYNFIMDYYDENYISFGFWYENVTQKNEANAIVDGVMGKREYSLGLISLSMYTAYNQVIGRWTDVTILGGSIGMYWAGFENKYSEPGISKTEKLASESSFGGEIYTGIRQYLFTNYVSIQAVVGYSFLSIPTINFENGNSISRTEDDMSPMENFIENGGFYGRIHISIGIPNNY